VARAATIYDALRFRRTVQGRVMSKPLFLEGRLNGTRVYASRYDSPGHAQRTGLRGLPEDWRLLGTPAPVPGVRPCWLLQFLEEQTRHQAFPRHRTPHYAIIRAWRRLALVLYRRDNRVAA